MKKIVILYSGGSDSYILKRYADLNRPAADVTCIYYDYGNEEIEIEKRLLPDFVSVRKVDWFNIPGHELLEKESDPGQKIYIPGRNLAFAVLAACQEMPDEIWMGTVYEENHTYASDKNEEFVRSATKAINYAIGPFKEHDIEIKFPFVENQLTKYGTVKWATQFGITANDIHNKTVSCYHPIDTGLSDDWKSCGVCKQCTRRALIHHCLGIFNRKHYVHDPFYNDQLLNWLEDALMNLDAEKLLVDEHSAELGEFPPYFLLLGYLLKRDHSISKFEDFIEETLISPWMNSRMFRTEFLEVKEYVDQLKEKDRRNTSKEINEIVKKKIKNIEPIVIENGSIIHPSLFEYANFDMSKSDWPRDPQKYHFSDDWFTQNIPYWEQIFNILRPLKILEIGSYEGMSTVWMAEKIKSYTFSSFASEINCVDTWDDDFRDGEKFPEQEMQSIEARFQHNILQVSYDANFVVFKMTSKEYFQNRRDTSKFDFIYIDGSHMACDVLSDLVYAFNMLRVGGVICCDDYLWNKEELGEQNPLNSPKLGIDSFVNVYQQKLHIISTPLYQLFIQKTQD